MVTRGPQVVLEGRARTVARGGAGRTMRENIAAMDALVAAGLTPDGNTVDGKTRSGNPAYDLVIAQFPREELSQWEIPSPLLNVTGSGTDPNSINVRDYGAIMDGNSHPLSTVFSSVAAAQVVYPHATSLNDEIDWAAIQAVVNKFPAVYIPQGTAIINRPVVSTATMPVTVHGVGQGSTVIVQTTAGQDGWQHNSAYSFHMFDLDFRCTGACGVALNMNFAGSATIFTVRGVTISGRVNTAVDYWHDAIRAIGCGRTSIERVLIAGYVGALASVGQGIYLAPTTTPVIGGSYIIEIENSIINNYQSALVLDSTGRAGNNNIQGVVLDWVNSNGCMQFITTLGVTLELVLNKCQAQTFGAIIHADNAQTVVVRDSYFIVSPANANAIAAQLPQDVFYINGGGNWTLSDNRIVLVGATVGFIVNVLNSAGGVYLKGNTVYIGGTAPFSSGFLSISSGCHHVIESGTTFSFWDNSWPLVTNANANGGVANIATFGAMGALQLSSFGSDQWQHAGSFITWNYPAGTGNMALFSSSAAAAGGFNFYTVTSNPASVPVLLATITAGGAMVGSPAAAHLVIAAINAAATQRKILQYQTAGLARWDIYADDTPESGANAGSNLIISSAADDGTILANVITFNRATGKVVIPAGLTINNANGCNWTQGVGAPVASATRGSIYSRTDGGVGTTLYVCQSGTTWNPVAGV